MRAYFFGWVLVALAALSACKDRAVPSAVNRPPTAQRLAALASAGVYMCPMDKDIRSYEPGKCPRCGMALVTSVPDPVEYQVEMTASPTPQPGIPTTLSFAVFDPWKGNPVTRFLEVHERLFHAFVVSSDLQFFTHGHPALEDGHFNYEVTLPHQGCNRVLTDFYPEASAPQLSVKTFFVGDEDSASAVLTPDLSTKQGVNLNVQLATIPAAPVVGVPTRLRFTVGPTDGFERYLGAWGHMIVASDDVIDMMHTHPSIADGGADVEFTVVFPRPHTYRIWVQFQRSGIVNTVHFDVPLQAPPADPVATLSALKPERSE